MWLLLSDGLRNKQHERLLYFKTTKTNRKLYPNERLFNHRSLSCQLGRNIGSLPVKKTVRNAYDSVSQKDKLDGVWRKQSLYAFRAVSDSAFSTVVFELLSKGLRLSCFHASPLLFVGSELFIGSLLGMFSVVANIIGVIERRAEESRTHRKFLENASSQLVADWDSYGSLREDLHSFDPFEIEEMVHWFEVLEELEGPGAIKFFQQVALDDSVEKRVTLARSLGRCQTRSNIVLCTLQQLALKDKSTFVKNAARNSIRELIRNNIVPSPPLNLSENLSVISTLNGEPSFQKFSIYEKLPSQFSGIVQHTINERSTTESNSDAYHESNFTPFDRMDILDIVMFCSLSCAIIGLQLYCIYHAVDLPFRFVALGWVFGVGGLIVYPHSGRLWHYLHQTTWLRALFSELATFS